MIQTEDVVAFIEKKNGIQLFDFQKRFLEDIIQGKIVGVPRCCGTSVLLNGYHAYLTNFYDQRRFESTGYDDLISGYEVLNSALLSGSILKRCAKMCDDKQSIEKFEREYMVKHKDFV